MADAAEGLFDVVLVFHTSRFARSQIEARKYPSSFVAESIHEMRDPDTGLAVPDPEKAPLIYELFRRYATGQESDRSLALWLNARGARTNRDHSFSKDTVREMLCNAAYAGYVSGLRDKRRSIRGLHEPMVSDELFDRVRSRTRVITQRS